MLGERAGAIRPRLDFSKARDRRDRGTTADREHDRAARLQELVADTDPALAVEPRAASDQSDPAVLAPTGAWTCRRDRGRPRRVARGPPAGRACRSPPPVRRARAGPPRAVRRVAAAPLTACTRKTHIHRRRARVRSAPPRDPRRPAPRPPPLRPAQRRSRSRRSRPPRLRSDSSSAANRNRRRPRDQLTSRSRPVSHS